MSVLWILGEAKSGKSELAEEIFAHLPGKKYYIGTLPRIPKYMDMIKKHSKRRPKDWELIEITNRLDSATRLIDGVSKNQVVATLLDGWGAYVTHRASKWGEENPNLTIAGEAYFVGQVSAEYHRLAGVCCYLIIVAHVSAHFPTASDYKSDPVAWRVRAVTNRCIRKADKVIYHDSENASCKDEKYVKKIARFMIAGS